MSQFHFSNALNKTMSKYGITSAWISRRSGVSDQAMSNFRKGKSELKTGTLEKIIEVLPEDAKEYFFNLLNCSDERLKALTMRANNDEKAEILRIIAASLSSSILVDEGQLK